MIDLPDDGVIEMPVDQLGLVILRDLIDTNDWNDRNYAMGAETAGYSHNARRAISEALGWLRARGLIARDPDQSAPDAIFITRTGHLVAEEGPDAFYATERLQRGLHPKIEAKARPQFLMGEYEQGVFVSFKSVEIHVRKLGGFGEDVIGVDLMNKAFGPTGPLVDPAASKGEKDATRALFAGAYGLLRNPSGHREVNYDDVTEAAEAVQLASLLMRILDRIEQRLTS
jgi:uncharacterized protein (TIGR02391 family)